MERRHEPRNAAEQKVLDAALAIARKVGEDITRGFGATIHDGDDGHRAIAVFGCPVNEAHEYCSLIAAELAEKGIITKPGYPAVRIDAGCALVWYR